MKREFDFNDIGKRMPYKVPEGFFDTLEDNIMSEIRKPENGHDCLADKRTRTSGKTAARTWKIGGAKLILPTAVSAAAAVLLIFYITRSGADTAEPCTMESVETAYSNLSPEDQEFIREIYENDIFYSEDF